MASPSTPSPQSQWSVYQWIRGWISGSSSMIAEDGDNADRMKDDLSFMELRDGKRLPHPWEIRERSSEWDDDSSMISARMFQPEDDRASQTSSLSSSKPTRSSATTCDTGFSTPGGRRYLSFAECQQLPKTDYMYAYTPVYSPYRNRNIEMPNMCRQPIRSSSQHVAGTLEAEYFTLRSRTTTTIKETVGEIPVYGTDFDDEANSQHPPQTPSQRFVFIKKCWSAVTFYLSLSVSWCKQATWRLFSSIGLLLLVIFVAVPKSIFSVTTQKISSFSLFFWQLMAFCATQPVAMASSAASAASKSSKVVMVKCQEVVTHFWMTIRKIGAKSKEVIKNTTVATAAKTTTWLRRAFWPLLLLLICILLLFYFPYGAVYNSAANFYNEMNTTKYLAYFEWPQSWKKTYDSSWYAESQLPQQPATNLPPIQQQQEQQQRPSEPVMVVQKVDCPECWKTYSEQVQKMLADRDKEIFSNLDAKLANAAVLAAENSEAKYTAAAQRLAVLENAINQLHQAVADARAEAKRTLDEAEMSRKDIREEDRAALQRLVDDMWQRVDAKLTASSDAFERKLVEQQTVANDRIEEAEQRIGEEVRRHVEETRKLASDAMAKADSASEAVAAIPPPPPPQPVTVECKTACPPPQPPTFGQQQQGAGLTSSDVESIVAGALNRYDADRTGQPDFALESSGGSVVNVRCSKTYDISAGTVSIFGFPVYFDTKSPRTAIQAGPLVPGNCWAFSGSRGFLVVRLSYRIFISSVSLEHIPKELAPLGRLDSAPRDFSVYSLANEADTVGRLLGNYTYDAVNGPALQTFEASPELSDRSETVQFIELRILSNYGHPNYTCIYRFRVHGHPADTTAAGNGFP